MEIFNFFRMKKTEEEKQPVYIRGHHLNILLDHFIKNTSLEDLELDVAHKYGDNFAKRQSEILKQISDGAPIILTDKLDSICGSGKDCAQMGRGPSNNFCLGLHENKLNSDHRFISLYGFRLDEPYNLKEVLKKLEERGRLQPWEIDRSIPYEYYR